MKTKQFILMLTLMIINSSVFAKDCTEEASKLTKLKGFGMIYSPSADTNTAYNGKDYLEMNKRPNGKDGAYSEIIKAKIENDRVIEITYGMKNTNNDLSSLEESNYRYNIQFNADCEVVEARIDFLNSEKESAFGTTLSKEYCDEILADEQSMEEYFKRNGKEKLVLRKAKMELCENFIFAKENTHNNYDDKASSRVIQE